MPGNFKLMFFPTAEGYVSAVYPDGITGGDPPKFAYVTNIRDHLGNLRMSITRDNGGKVILQERNYYPFGLLHQGYNEEKHEIKYTEQEEDKIFTPQVVAGHYKYWYQEQERQTDLDLNWDSFKYRNYDYSIGRFMSVDPLAEKYPYNGVYNFSENRVIDGRELEGLEWEPVKDDNGRYIDFKWNPDEAYDENGKLKDGFYETAILFAEKNKEPESGSANKKSGFHATATVYLSNGKKKTYDATTLPSDSKLFGTVEEGLYIAYKGTHPMSGGYPALNVYTLNGSRKLPARNGRNPRNGSKFVVGVNIHKTGKNDYLGTYKRNGKIHGISEGCFCIRRGKGDKLYNDFISNFKSGQKIGVILLRSKQPQTQSSYFRLFYPLPRVKTDKTYVAPNY